MDSLIEPLHNEIWELIHTVFLSKQMDLQVKSKGITLNTGVAKAIYLRASIPQRN